MNLRWNSEQYRFEAEFSPDFQGDLAAVKAAGFKTTGAPSWVWHTYKAASLNKLRENRPTSGLTISPEARANFTRLWTVEERNAKVKAELAEHKKQLKKTLRIQEQEGNAVPIPEKGWVGKEDLPVKLAITLSIKPSPPLAGPKCIVCGDVVAFYEVQNPPTCLWCEKLVLDNSLEVC